MAVAVPQTQEITVAWTAMPATNSTKRAMSSPSESTDSKKRCHSDADEVVKEPISDTSYRERKLSVASENPSNDETNDDYKWPAMTRKRQRMTEEERKARHREVQRQFMQRKLAKLDEMRKLVVVLEKQFVLLQLSQERARLEHENDYLHRRVQACPPHWTHEHPEDAQRRLHSMPPPHSYPAHTTSFQHHSVSQPHRPHTGMLPWDEILEAVSEANV